MDKLALLIAPQAHLKILFPENVQIVIQNVLPAMEPTLGIAFLVSQVDISLKLKNLV